MKKVLSLGLVLVILLGCCACGASNEDVRGEIIQNVPATTATPETTAPAPEFSLGQTANNTYINEYLGMQCTLPEEWVFYTDEEILALNNIVGNVLDEEIAQKIQQANVIYDMYAGVPDSGYSVNVTLEKINPIQLLTVDLQQVLESQIETIETSYDSMGYTNTTARYGKVTVDGEAYDGLYITANIQGLNFYGVSFAFVRGNYMANICVTSLAEDTTGEILGYFTID